MFAMAATLVKPSLAPRSGLAADNVVQHQTAISAAGQAAELRGQRLHLYILTKARFDFGGSWMIAL